MVIATKALMENFQSQANLKKLYSLSFQAIFNDKLSCLLSANIRSLVQYLLVSLRVCLPLEQDTVRCSTWVASNLASECKIRKVTNTLAYYLK